MIHQLITRLTWPVGFFSYDRRDNCCRQQLRRREQVAAERVDRYAE
jgi:hypothetical protein